MRLLILALVIPLTFACSTAAATADPRDLTSAPSRQGTWPLRPVPEVAAGFDPPSTAWGRGHRGVDLIGHAGQRVLSSLGGTITFAAPLAGRGVVVVDHGAVRTTYEPVSTLVQVGDTVAKGAVIGTLQRASSHCFPRTCLHWGLRSLEAYLDPLTLVGAGPIRLWPYQERDTGSSRTLRGARLLAVV